MNQFIKLVCISIAFIASAHAMQDADLGKRLITAAYTGASKEVERLINTRAPIDYANFSGTTALMYAAMHNHIPCTQALITAKAQVNQVDNGNQTALAWAAANSHQSISELLVEAMLWTPSQKQKTKICIFIDCLKKQRALWEIYRIRKDLFKNHLAQAAYEQNRNDFANSIAYQQIAKLEDYPIKIALLEKYNPEPATPDSQSWCSVQ